MWSWSWSSISLTSVRDIKNAGNGIMKLSQKGSLDNDADPWRLAITFILNLNHFATKKNFKFFDISWRKLLIWQGLEPHELKIILFIIKLCLLCLGLHSHWIFVQHKYTFHIINTNYKTFLCGPLLWGDIFLTTFERERNHLLFQSKQVTC